MHRAVVTIGVTLSLVIAFAAGRAVRPDSSSSRSVKGQLEGAILESTPIDIGSALPIQCDQIRVENFGAIGFPELSDLLRTSSAAQMRSITSRVNALSFTPQSRSAVINFYGVWAQVDLPAALKSLQEISDHRLRFTAVGALLTAAPAEMGHVLQSVSALTKTERREIIPRALTEWSFCDPAAAAGFAENHPTDMTRSDYQVVLLNWASADLIAARNWFEQHEKPHATGALGLLRAWWQTDRQGAYEYLLQNAGSAEFAEAVEKQGYEVFHESPEDARMLVTRASGEAADQALNQIVGAVIGESAERSDIASLASWMITLPVERWSDHISPVLIAWSDQRKPELLTWIQSQEVPVRDVLLQQYCPMQEANAENFRLALTIHDQTQREQAVAAIMAQLAENPEEAPERVRELGLSSRSTSYLLHLLQKEDTKK